MANYATLKAAIAAAIKQNGNNEITGTLLQQQLLAMVNSLGAGYQYVGIATPSTNPGTPDQNVAYFVARPGLYSNMGSLTLEYGEIGFLLYNGDWSKKTVIFSPSTILRNSAPNNGYPNASNYFADLDGYGKHLVFKIYPGQNVKVVAGSNYTFVGFLKNYTPPVLEQQISYSSVDGYTTRIQVQPGTSGEYVAPNDAQYLIVAYGNDAFHNLDVSMVIIDDAIAYANNNAIVSTQQLNQLLQNIEQEIANLSENTSKKFSELDTIRDATTETADVVMRHAVSTYVPSETGNRFSIIYKVKKGQRINARLIYGGGLYCALYSSINEALVGGVDGLIEGISSYTELLINAEFVSDGYCILKYKNSDDSAITDQQIVDIKNKISIQILGNTSYGVIDVLGLKKYNVVEYPGYMASNGTSTLMYSEGVASLYVNIKPGDVIKLTANADRNTNYCFCRSMFFPTANGQPFDICSGKSRVVVPANNEAEETAPDDAAYLYLTKASDIGSGLPQRFSINGIDVDVTLRGTQYFMRQTDPTETKFILDNGKKSLHIGELVQGQIDSIGAVTPNAKYVFQYCALVIPDYGTKVNIKCPNDINVGFLTGTSTTDSYISLSNNSGLLNNGDTFTFDGYNKQVYRVYFTRDAGASIISVSEIQQMLDSGEIAIYYDYVGGDIVARNSGPDMYIKGLMRKFTGVLTERLNDLPVFSHLSDIHGDVVRLRSFLEYSKALKVDAALLTGDLVPMSGVYDRTNWVDELIDSIDVQTLICMGNHDARGNGTELAQNNILKHTIQKFSLTTPSGVQYPTYFYKDLTDKNIRIIALNLYCPGQYDTNHWHLTQAQITWFINTLASTPANYGVIVLMHSPETTTNKDNNYSKFYQMFDTGSITFNNEYLPFRKIIDAFISKTTLSGSFSEQVSGGSTETITFSADFTGLATGVEFICYATGHRHKDCVGYVDGATNKQLMLNICLGMALYGGPEYLYYAQESDLPRGGAGFTQDSFNIYVVDRATKSIKIGRVGSNMNSNFEMRDYMTIPYAD